MQFKGVLSGYLLQKIFTRTQILLSMQCVRARVASANEWELAHRMTHDAHAWSPYLSMSFKIRMVIECTSDICILIAEHLKGSKLFMRYHIVGEAILKISFSITSNSICICIFHCGVVGFFFLYRIEYLQAMTITDDCLFAHLYRSMHLNTI